MIKRERWMRVCPRASPEGRREAADDLQPRVGDDSHDEVQHAVHRLRDEHDEVDVLSSTYLQGSCWCDGGKEVIFGWLALHAPGPWQRI